MNTPYSIVIAVINTTFMLTLFSLLFGYLRDTGNLRS